MNWIFQLRRAIVGVVATNAATAFLGILGGILAARFVSPETSGEYRAYTIPLLYMTIMHLGTPDGIYRLIPFYRGMNEVPRISQIIATAKIWNITLSAIASIIFFIIAIHELYRKNNIGAIGWISQIPVAWGVFYTNTLATIARAESRFKAVGMMQLSQSIIQFGLVFTLPYLQFFGLALRTALPSFIALIIMNRYRSRSVYTDFSINTLKQIIKSGLPFFGWIYIAGPLWIASESFLVLKFHGHRELGYLSVALVVREAMLIFPQSVQQVLIPRIVEGYARSSDNIQQSKELRRAAYLTTLIVSITIPPTYILINLLLPIAAPMYVDAISAIGIALMFCIPQCLMLPLNTYFAIGDHRSFGKNTVFGISIFFICFLAMPDYLSGSTSVLIASLIGRTMSVLWLYLSLKNEESYS